jgi:hypothetical protein
MLMSSRSDSLLRSRLMTSRGRRTAMIHPGRWLLWLTAVIALWWSICANSCTTPHWRDFDGGPTDAEAGK